MKAAGKPRTRAAIVALAVLAGASVSALTSSPAAASYYEQGVSFSDVIERDSVPYKLNVKAVRDMGGRVRLDVSISTLSESASPAQLRQRQTWSFDLEADEFTEDGDAYRIDAGSDQEPFRVKLVVERREGASCSEDQRLFVTKPEDGAFRIETGNEVFGTITELPECGAEYWFSSGPPPPPPPCPVEGIHVSSGTLELKRPFAADRARLDLRNFVERDISGQLVSWLVKVRGTVPASSFRLNRDFEGSFSADGAPWLTGVARFEPRGRITRGDWFNCRGGREARTFVRRGSITGDLTLDVIGYESYRIDDPNAWAFRSRVRSR